jgi:hypothetical protein
VLLRQEPLREYSRRLNDVALRGKAALADALSRVSWSESVSTVREQLIAAMDVCCGASALCSWPVKLQ